MYSNPIMGVINITPDSFSDGGKYSESSLLKDRVGLFTKFDVEIVDIGAESTAPFNNPIGIDQEIKRFEEIFFPVLDEKELFEGITFSIDTYNLETFKYVYQRIKASYPNNRIIFNDVSGVIGDDLIKLLAEDCVDCDYIYSHTLTSQRELSSNHMDNVLSNSKEETVDELKRYFSAASKIFDENNLGSRVYFDPCFGFSKTMEQNLYLIRKIDKLISEFSSERKWVLGISRKSFLKKSIELETPESDIQTQTEYLQTLILANWLKTLKDYQVLYRLHDPAVYYSARKGMEILNG